MSELSDQTLMEDVQSEQDFAISEYDITASPNDFNISTIVNFMDRGSISIPPYQRNYTWDKRRASKLIESLMLGLPVPQLFLYEESRNKFSILDGQQRLMSIYFFVKGRFPKKEARAELRETFAEHGLFPDSVLADDSKFVDFSLDLPGKDDLKSSPFHGSKYLTLEDNRNTFDLRTVRCVLIKQSSPDDDNSSVFEVFDRLNTGGVNLKPQEIRANLYYSEFYQMIYDVNKDANWRHIFGNVVRDLNLRDIELILRAFAMLIEGETYRPTMTRFLNTFSSKIKNRKIQVDIELLRQFFLEFCRCAVSVGATHSFRASSSERFSIAIFESAFRAFCKDGFTNGRLEWASPITAETLAQIKLAVQPLTLFGTANRENVEKRFLEADNVIKEI